MKKSNKNNSRLNILVPLLLLVIAISAQFSLKARFWNYYYPEVQVADYADFLLQAFPRQLKGFVAGFMRLTADEYMHIGPSKKVKQNFIAGSFAGNTEIMTLLKIALYFDPTHIDTYTVMSQNLCMYLDRFGEGIRLIQTGILANKDSVELHKLYAAGAYCYGFAESYTYSSDMPVKNNRAVALNYLDAAIKSYKANACRMTEESYDTFANIDNYYILKSRFLLDVGRKEEALEAWKHVPESLRNNLSGKYFDMFEKGIDVPDLPEQLLLPNSLPEEKEHAQDQRRHDSDSTNEHDHSKGSECPHCNAVSTWDLLVRSRDTMFQALLMFVLAILLRKFI